ncbi:EmrB/QacA subfamily drug resistance transporter [Streptomyces sp. 3211.6]|uniref:MFS transporter n=1 Tax=unclassified Streptomyces TaxID=2593676 RepID=UPI0009A5478C|nr:MULTISPECIES: MFS transporter [unclassified Streptomyces]RKT04576.1 EmrB/QacA subfamily drug resistance transporter [Streptomyces sp. 3211.6]RPF40451.1 EmrB/QacA subfamily drug resistance transporter [Streptomyces sp. Ag109_G2-6]
MNPEVSPGRRRLILVVLAVTGLVVVMDLTILNVALATIQEDLATTTAGLQWALDAYLITFAAFIFTGGVTADRFGRKKILIAGMLVFGVASVLAAYSGSITELIIWRAVMGIGAATVPTVTLAILINVYPPAERPKAIAGWAGTAGIATVVGPLVGGLLLQVSWWGSVFLINAPLILLGIALIAWLVPESKNTLNKTFDPAGVVLSVAGVGVLVYGLVNGGEKGEWLALGTVGPIAAGIVLLGLLVWVEGRLTVPALDMSLLKDSRFSAGTFSIALAFFGLIGSLFVTAVYFQSVHGYRPLEVGALMLPIGVGGFFMSQRCPALIARFGAGRVVACGATAMAVAFVCFAFVDHSTSFWVLAVIQLILGLGWGVIMTPATASLMSAVPPVKAGAGQAVSQTVRQVSGALGVAVIGSLLGASYRSGLGSAADVLPTELREEAAGSVGATLRALGTAGDKVSAADAEALKQHAFDAYQSGMQVTMLISAVIALAATVVALRWLPGRPPQAAATAPAGAAPATAQK